ncbi:hypothetical protein H0H81_012464 [Sphagnurus paluster]|uniref:Major facilitator superfamily (MFS) profile domain-containing protein n=1 Tax=Sphagnurus paluster TaxID=117069 RepID=A0A9P7FTZ0_9AGAR|nr:hypothetical protein H0H81_012464 [Sphagnurus paluster]
MYPPVPGSTHLEAYALTHLQPNSLPALVVEDDPLDAVEFHAAPTYLSDRTRRLSRTSHAHSVAASREEVSKSVKDDHETTTSSTILPISGTLDAAPIQGAKDKQARSARTLGVIHFVVLCCCIFGSGWNDGSTGPLLPVLQRDYNIVGIPSGINNAQANGYVSSLNRSMETKLGILHATYGLGAFTSPFVATYFSGRRHWSHHYLVSATIAIHNTLAAVVALRFKRLDQLLLEGGQAPTPESEPSTATTREHANTYSQLLRLKAVHILSVFAIIYIGIEVTVGGWIVTFIIRERGGGHSSGYISSGFFGGLMLGRIGLMWLNKLVGGHLVILIYGIIAIILEITIWFVPSIIGNAIAVSFVGLVLGPMFPVMVSHASKVLPRWMLTVCIGWISSIGMVGSAALPFLTGLLASRFGISSLQPLMVSMMAAMLIVWALVPRSPRRMD